MVCIKSALDRIFAVLFYGLLEVDAFYMVFYFYYIGILQDAVSLGHCLLVVLCNIIDSSINRTPQQQGNKYKELYTSWGISRMQP